MPRSSRRMSRRNLTFTRRQAIDEYRRPFADVDRINVAPMRAAARQLVNAHIRYCDYTADPGHTSLVAMNYIQEVRMAVDRLDQAIKGVGLFDCRSTGIEEFDQERKKVDLYDCKLSGQGDTRKVTFVATIVAATRRLLQSIPDAIYLEAGKVFLFDRGAIRDIEFAVEDLQTHQPDHNHGNKSHRKIRPKLRTRPMTLKEAARLMGYLKNRSPTNAVKALRAAINSGAVSCESHTRQQHVFSKKDFPAEVCAKLAPTDPHSP